MIKQIEESTKFGKDLKRAKKRGKDLGKLKRIVADLFEGKELHPKHRDHALIGNWYPSRDCHIEPDWILIYTIEGETLRLERTGTHSDLF